MRFLALFVSHQLSHHRHCEGDRRLRRTAGHFLSRRTIHPFIADLLYLTRYFIGVHVSASWNLHYGTVCTYRKRFEMVSIHHIIPHMTAEKLTVYLGSQQRVVAHYRSRNVATPSKLFHVDHGEWRAHVNKGNLKLFCMQPNWALRRLWSINIKPTSSTLSPKDFIPSRWNTATMIPQLKAKKDLP